MILGIVGNRGQGKTRLAAKWAYENYKAGRKIISNMGFSFPHARVENMADIEGELKNCLLVLDEIHTLMDSRTSSKKDNRKWSYLFLQTRKLDVDMLWTSQFIHQVDLRLRSTTDVMVSCRNLGSMTDPHFSMKAARPDGFSFEWEESPGKEFEVYDTNEVIHEWSPFDKS